MKRPALQNERVAVLTNGISGPKSLRDFRETRPGAGEKVRAEILALGGKFVVHSRLSLETSFAEQYYFRSNEKSGFGFGCFGFSIEHKI